MSDEIPHPHVPTDAQVFDATDAQRFRRVVESLPLAVYLDHPDTHAASFYVSPQIETMFGYSSERWHEEAFFESVIHPDDRERMLAEHTEAFERGDERWSFRYRIAAADGRIIWVRDDAIIVRDASGEPDYVQGFLIDITEEWSASPSAPPRSRLSAMPSTAIAGSSRTSRSPCTSTGRTRPGHPSTSARRWSGCSATPWSAGWYPAFFLSVVHPEDRERIQAETTQELQGGDGTASSEYRLIAADGRTVHIRDDQWILRDADGRPEWLQGFMMDVTEERHARAELAEALAQVEQTERHYRQLVEAIPVAMYRSASTRTTPPST